MKVAHQEWFKDEYRISTHKAELDIKSIHSFLHHCYWAKGIPEDVVKKSIEGSLSFGVFKDAKQIGFARVITDYATFMYIADVFIIDDYRGHGLAIWLMEVIVNHKALKGIRTWTLLTADAHSLYEKFDFEVPEDTSKFMRRKVPYPYPLEPKKE